MDATILRALHARRPAIRRQWESLLRLEKPASGLAHPDTLVRMIDWTLDEAFAELDDATDCTERRRPLLKRMPSYGHVRDACACGRNPLIEYFLAGERAMLEALVLVQAESPAASNNLHRTTASEMHVVLREIANREVGLFCSVCQHQHSQPSTARSQPALAHD